MAYSTDFYKKKLEVKERQLADAQQNNRGLLQAMQNLNYKLALTEKEVEAAKRLIWAMAKTNGGEIRIPDYIMRTVDDTSQIKSFHDPSDLTTVIQSINATRPEKKNGNGEKNEGGQPS